ncbi:MAG: chain length determinant protein tyrosine kinase EpsG [Nitrosomonadales bacterium]|nr:chain length determinant protein tyrosine kinase EpsG [Nitrosomonadales bacterium]
MKTETTVDRAIGAILVDAGKLSVKDAEKILRLQKTEKIRFGDAGIKLGLLSQGDIQRALANQYDYPYLLKGDGAVSDALVAAYHPFSSQVEALRTLRSQLMLRWFTGEAERKMLTVVSPVRSEGRSYLAANLAIVFSQLGERTLLIDADMRNPCQHELFKLKNGNGLSSILAGRDDIQAVHRVRNFVDLSVLTAGPIPPNPQELLGRPSLTALLEHLKEQFDVILVDTPAAAEFAEAHTLAARAGAAIVAARKNVSLLDQVRQQTESMTQAGVAVVGTVLSEF